MFGKGSIKRWHIGNGIYYREELIRKTVYYIGLLGSAFIRDGTYLEGILLE